MFRPCCSTATRISVPPLSVAEEMHSKIPDSILVVIPEVGHQSNIEAADLFNAEVRRFLVSR